VWWLARHLPELPRAWLVHEKQHILKYAPGLRQLRANALHPQHSLATSARVTRLKRAHFLVNTWTVNEPSRAVELARSGVDAIISDVPGAILAALASDPR